MHVVIPGPGHQRITAGDFCPTRVMALVGATHRRDATGQTEKLVALAAMPQGPDIVADLSLAILQPPPWRRALEMGFAAASLPIYTVRRREGRVDPAELLERSVEQMEGGIGLLTIHPTARRDIMGLCKEPSSPVDLARRWNCYGGVTPKVGESGMSQVAWKGLWLANFSRQRAANQNQGWDGSPGRSRRVDRLAETSDRGA